MKKIFITCFKLFMNLVYAVLKLLPSTNKIVFISRQSNEVNLDFKMLISELQENDKKVKIVVLTRRLEKDILSKIKYFFHMFKQMYHMATAKVVVLDSYCIMVSVLKHKKKLKIIQIWHALGSLKKFGYSSLDKKGGRDSKTASLMNMHKNYTYILTSSKVSKPYFQEAFNAKDEQMKIMNLPRVDFLQSKESQKSVLERFYEIYPETKNNRKNILYCPTQRKDEKIPVDKMISEVDFEKYNLVVKLHNGTEIICVDSKNKIKHGKNFSGMELLHVGDYIISDYSAIVYEAAITGKPIYLYTFDYDKYVDERGFYINYKTEMPGEICKDFKKIMNLIEKEKFDYKKEKSFCEKYIENLDQNATKELARFILEEMK